MTKEIKLSDKFIIGGNRRFTLIAGPCAIESEEMTMEVAAELKTICNELNINLIFKSSFDKANRSSVSSPRGIGIDRGLQILKRVKDELGLPIVTDVHECWQCERVADVADVIQIPAFLSRQTDLLVAAAKTSKIVHIKKGQFMAPWDMKNVVDKMLDSGNDKILLGERGSSFGYNNLVVDMTGLVEMRKFGYPVVFDATHAVQKPGGQGTSTGGNREMVPYLMRAALAVGVDVIFTEVHPDPDHAFSDGPNQLHLSNIRSILEQAILIDDITKKFLSQESQLHQKTRNEITNNYANPHDIRKIKLLLTDVDGVLTDAGMYYTNSGNEMKKFNVHDGMGLQLIKKAGIKTGIITSETSKLVENRNDKLKLDYLFQGRINVGKLSSAIEICENEGITLEEVAYIGDDVNCIELLSAVGFPACPQDAVDEIKQIPGILILSKKGGMGCVRELTDIILKK
jgi:2-dehydro-3-deoxyphosphooctonate aldolase (KDO 8-P synthase)